MLNGVDRGVGQFGVWEGLTDLYFIGLMTDRTRLLVMYTLIHRVEDNLRFVLFRYFSRGKTARE